MAALQAGDVVTGKPGRENAQAVVNLSNIANLEARGVLPRAAPKEVHRPLRKKYSNQPLPERPREVQSRSTPAVASRSPAPSASFLALDDDDTAIPPDTHGAVGPNHLMTVHNTQVRIQDRAGNVISTVSLNNFWASLNKPTAPDVFDPRVMYDPYGGRFIFSAGADAVSDSASVLIGVSQTDDPTGAWNLFRIDVDDTDFLFADFPSLGFNKDWIVVSANMFDNFFGNFTQVNIYAFDKAALYAGTSAKHTLLIDDSAFGFTICPAATYDPALATMYLMEDYDSFSGQLRINTITGAVGSEVLTLNTAFPTVINDPWLPVGDFAPQSGSTELIDSGDSRMMNVVYRNGTLWGSHGIFLPFALGPTHSVVQWWQVEPVGRIVQRGRLDDPTGATFYSYPTIAVNKDEDVLIGYSRFAANQFASANYAFRRASDPKNTLRADTVLKAGEASYAKKKSGTVVRWGDYSATVVDPLNDTDLWTIQQFAATPSLSVDRWGTWWGKIVPVDTGINVTVTASDDFASEAGGNPGRFLIKRSSNAGALTVNYALTGTAVNGADYELLSGTVAIPDGFDSVPVTINPLNNDIVDGTRTVFLTLSPGAGYVVGAPYAALVNIFDDEQLKITAGPTATPNPAITGLSIEFSVTADLTDITEVYWDFDDFTEDTTNRLNVVHAFSEPGEYRVVVLLTHKSGSTAVGFVDVIVSDDTDSDGIPDVSDPDDDNDGFPDEVEIALDTDPLDPNSTPLNGSPAATVKPMRVTRVQCRLNYRTFFADTLSLTGSLPVAAGMAPESSRAVVDFGGIAAAFTLDKRGRGTFGLSSVKFAIRRRKSQILEQSARFQVRFKEGDFLEAFADEGISDENSVKDEKHTIKASILLNSDVYQQDVPVLYTSKPFVGASLKLDTKK